MKNNQTHHLTTVKSQLAQAALDSLMSNLVILDEKGLIISANHAWRQFARSNGGREEAVLEGVNYLTVCDSANGGNFEEAGQVSAGIRAVLNGEQETYSLEYPCHAPNEKRWFICRVTRFFENNQARVVINHENITERRLAEEDLRESEEKWRTLVNTTPDYIALHDEQGRFLFLNHYAEGFSEQDVLGSSVYQYLAPQSEALFRDKMEACMHSWKSQKFEHIAMGDLEIMRTYEEYLVPMRNKNNEINILVVGRDITERKQAEESIRQSEAVLKDAQRIAQMGSWRVSLNDGSIQWSEEMYRIYGVDKSTFEHTIFALFELIHPEDRGLMDAWIELVASKQDPEAIEFRILRPDGSIRHIRGLGELIRDQAGQARFLIGTSQDITERKRTEASLRETNEYLENLFNYANAPIIVWDPQFKITRFNHAFEKITGRTAAEVLGKPLEILFPQSEINSSMQLIHNTQSGERWEIVEIDIQHQDGSIRTVLWNSATLFSADGVNPVATIAQGQDITGRKQAETELRLHRDHLEEIVRERTSELIIAKEQAETANRAKGEFLAVMSHEIRTPLNGVLGLAYLVLQTELSAKQHDYLVRLQSSGKSLLAIIDDILDFSKIEAGKLTIEKVDFSLDDVLNELSNLVAPRAQEKGLELVFNAEMNIPRLLRGDPLRLKQVLINLLGNAVKFTESGEIVTKIRLVHKNSMYVGLEFSVCDTGIGLTNAQIAHLFQPFSQADISISRRYGGTGLGLTISQRLVNLLGGEIQVQSQTGKGSTFKFMLEFEKQTSIDKAAFVTAPEMEGLRVLVVENHAATQEFLQSVLESFSFECVVTETAEDGFRLLGQTGYKPFGLVLMNWKLPGATYGWDAAAHIRKNLHLVKIPIIMLGSADEMLKQDDSATISGMLVKPITRSQLFDTVMQVFGHKSLTHGGSATDSVSEEIIGKLQGKQVLLVEDNEINQLVAMELLQQMGMLVSVSNSGEQAVRMVDDGSFQVILMDIQMPGMDGFEATAQIRKSEGLGQPRLPIIAMTAHALNGDSQKAMEAGFSDYVSKPVDVNKLANVLLRWLDKAPASSEIVDKSRNQNAIELPEAHGSIDTAAALRRLGENKKLYRQILLRFKAEHTLDVQMIRTALKNNDVELATLLAHTLKGLAGTIGADDLGAAAKELETALTKLDEPFTGGLITQMEQKLGAVLTMIEKIL